MNVNLDESASELLIALKKEMREKTKVKVSFSDAVRELSRRAGKGK